jgi:hypothetical protein
MADENEILKKTAALAPRERAAAIAHAIYILAGEATPGWQMRVAADWNDLSEEAKAFNLTTIDTWLKHDGLATAWIDAIQSLQNQSR